MNKIEFGNNIEIMKKWAEQGVKVQTCITSPPYFGLRSYLDSNDPQKQYELGLEQTPQQYVDNIVEVFRRVRDILADDGTLWLNIGDSYASYRDGKATPDTTRGENNGTLVPKGLAKNRMSSTFAGTSIKHKDLIGIPWMLAFALREDGWYLRQDIIWCLSGGAWVYARTQKGDMPVMVKDLVRLNPSSIKLWNGEKWTQVLGWGQSNDTSERIELVFRSGERVGCTGSHLWPTQRGNVAARDLKCGDIISSCQLPEPSPAKKAPYLTDELLWLIGLYLAEGSRSEDTIQLSLSLDEKKWLPLIGTAAEQMGATMSYSEDGNSLNVRLYGRVLKAVIDDYIGGKNAHNKHVTTKTWMLPNHDLKMIANGYFDCDGHNDGGRIRLGFCRNYALERDLRTMAARLGATITLNPTTVKFQNRVFPSFRGEWRWERSGHHNEKNRGEIVKIRTSRARKFWDISVEDEPHLFSLSSGILTHNCKPNPMPESVKDRCTKSHEYIFLLSKSERYYFDFESIKEEANTKPISRNKASEGYHADYPHGDRFSEGERVWGADGKRNRRSVWNVSTKPYKGAHFATFPPDLIEPCILAGSKVGDIVLDPFMGSGTTAAVALKHNRQYLGCELNQNYAILQQQRINERLKSVGQVDYTLIDELFTIGEPK